MVVPIAFVSEHSETLVELDLEYRELALQSGVPHYVRIPTVQTDPGFIKGLAGFVKSKQTCDAGSCWCGAIK
jgi:protoporphyrin/coproporphyrin ferrochelatase